MALRPGHAPHTRCAPRRCWRLRCIAALPLQLERTMRTRYKIDTYQQTYFVIDSFEQLFDMTAANFAPMYERLRGVVAV